MPFSFHQLFRQLLHLLTQQLLPLLGGREELPLQLGALQLVTQVRDGGLGRW